MTIDFVLKPFQPAQFDEYAAWFADPELNQALGPIDQAWLDAVFSQSESASVTWAVLHGNELIAVVETVLDPERHLPAGITALAVKPDLRRQGIGTKVLQQILAHHHSKGIQEHIAYVLIHNSGARRCLENAGFVLVTTQPDDRGYIEFRHHRSRDLA